MSIDENLQALIIHLTSFRKKKLCLQFPPTHKGN